MNKIINILSLIEQAQGSTDKKNILKNHMSPMLHEFFNLFYKEVNYNLSARSFEKIMDYNSSDHGTYSDVGELFYFHGVTSTVNVNYSLEQIKEFLKKLETIRGDEAIVYLQKYYETLNTDFQKWITRFIVGDLRIGLSLKTINKVFVECGYEPIEKFAVQLCGKIANIKEYCGGFPIGVGCKYDGMRCIVEKNSDKIGMTSRQGKDITFVPELIEFFKSITHDFIIDGEILCNSFNDLQKRIGRKADNIEPIEGLHFRVYDFLKFNGCSYKEEVQKDRSRLLRTHFKESDMLKLEEYYHVDTQEKLERIYKIMCERGEEGIVIKLLDRPYEYDNRKNWWKVKPKNSNTFKIIDFKYGTGKNKDKISILIIEDKSKSIISNVGSGLTDADREYCTMNKEKLIGKLCDITYYEITKNNTSNKYSLRFPSFEKFREDINDADDLQQ